MNHERHKGARRKQGFAPLCDFVSLVVNEFSAPPKILSKRAPRATHGILDSLPDASKLNTHMGHWPLATDHWQLATAFQGGIVRKYLGVLAGGAALCVMSWAQVPTQAPTPAPAPAQAPAPEPAEIPTPPAKPAPPARPFPRFEFFAGGSYAEAGLFNAGHWAGLPGWDASLGLNATSWLGFI